VISPDDPTEQDREAEWTAEVGASFIANLDDDDWNGIRDADDDVVNGPADYWDLAAVVTRAWPEAPDGAIGHLTIDAESAESVRIFKVLADQTAVPILGSTGACTAPTDCFYTYETTFTTEEVRSGLYLVIEARRFKGQWLASFPMIDANTSDEAKKNLWTGLVDLAYDIKEADGTQVITEASPDGFDRVKLRVAPWLLLGSLGEHDMLYSSSWSTVFVNGNTAATEAAGVVYNKIQDSYSSSAAQKAGWGDIWTEDIFQTGWTAFPGENGVLRGMRIANPRPWGRNDNDENDIPIRWLNGDASVGRIPAFLGADHGTAEFYNPEHRGTGDTQDSHGNHDLVPPFPGFSQGRIIHGNNTFAETNAFYNAQLVQGPAIVLDTTWLAVEHVDEFFHWVPSNNALGWKLLVASPKLMLDMLEEMQAAGHGELELHNGRGGFFEMTIDEILTNQDLLEWSQVAGTKVDDHVATMKLETGLTDADIIYIPTFFEDLASNEKVAWNPGMVNMRMLGKVASIAKPFGPKIDGVDPFETDIQARLGTPASGLGKDGQGLQIFFTDDWNYHVSLGEVHCGTNEASNPPVEGGQWWESGK
jgi:protein-arginine deiminase